MKKLFKYSIVAVMTLFVSMNASAYCYNYTTVPNDPANTLMYTLPNGLRLYMSVNKDEPRIQTYIPVRVGGKNDPAETTGLAHYFEHLMFKGTPNYGTSDYAAEKPMLDQIETLFEVYRQTTDSTARAAIYHQIDSISYQASLIAIPNEYDKLMSTIGAQGTNAYTSYDVTCYVEDIPSNQIDNWAKIQSDRFIQPVLRGFHTELETIYEEKNMSLTNDGRKALETMLTGLFPNHPYGTQTVLGTQEHLKNPSITNVKKYHDQWYVPNNMAIVAVGDFDPDNFVDIVTKYFGGMKPNPSLPVLKIVPETPITTPIVKEVKGLEAEMLYLAWRLPAAKDKDMMVMNILSEVLQNGKSGLIDRDITQKQAALGVSTFMYGLADHGVFLAAGQAKEGQTLDDVRALIIEEIEKLCKGDFDEDLIKAIVNNYKLGMQERLEKRNNHASLYVDAFVNGEEWADVVADIERIDKITKADVVEVANRYLGSNNYVAIYKRQGQDDSVAKISKPAITPIATNRNVSSAFLREVQASTVEPVEPRFVDFKKDLTFAKTKKGNVEVMYNQNKTNDLFTLTFVYDYGTYADKALSYAPSYLGLLGTKDRTVAQIKNDFYSLACTYVVFPTAERTYVMISGLSENMDKALKLYEDYVANAVSDATVWNSLVERNIKSMNDAKSNQSSNFSCLSSFATYGGKEGNPRFVTLYTPEQLRQLDPETVLGSVRALAGYKHRIIYYGPKTLKEAMASINKNHRIPGKLVDVPATPYFEQAKPTETTIYIAPYDAKQVYMTSFANRGEMYDPAQQPVIGAYNEYFGGSMNSIVFQEMRESRSLAYSAWAGVNTPAKAGRPYTSGTFIATQNDKLMDAIAAFNEIINDMPESEAAFVLAKEGMDSRLRTSRTIKDNIAWAWIGAQDHGIDYDIDSKVFEALPGMKLADIIAYQQQHVKGNVYNYAILGKIEDLDLDALRKIGKVVILTTEEIFGY